VREKSVRKMKKKGQLRKSKKDRRPEKGVVFGRKGKQRGGGALWEEVSVKDKKESVACA